MSEVEDFETLLHLSKKAVKKAYRKKKAEKQY